MGFHDVGSYHLEQDTTPHFLNISSEVKTICLRNVVGVSKGMLPVKYYCSKTSCLMSLKFHVVHRTLTKLL